MVSANLIPDDWEEPGDLHEFLQTIRDQRPDADIKGIRRAYFVAEKAHSGQIRSSGEPYISHPLSVAKIVADLSLDDSSIIAALLHDVLEDNPSFTAEYIESHFGSQVRELVEGVTKLTLQSNIQLSDRQKAHAETTRAAETLRKMLLAMAKDFRVMVVKLADRLHNMSTLDSLPPEKRTRIANETLSIYAPLAARLGIWQIKWQLEDLSFRTLHPDEFLDVSEKVHKTRSERQQELSLAIMKIKDSFEEKGIKFTEVRGRPKHLYSIFNKMVKQGLPFEEIYDLLALRIIMPDISGCYLALGVVHELFTPITALFYDYIARPKSNGYQSLHTKVVGPNGQPLEVQIRTEEMHRVAEFGIAAHWAYKEGSENSKDASKLKELGNQLFDWSTDTQIGSDFLRSISTDLFSEQVFVFTPKGDVIDLPKDSTPVDFAFRVHSALGITLTGSKVNGFMVPLNTILKNGDVVELITRSNATPSLDWLEFIKSPHTRSKLRGYFRKLNRDDNALRGKAALERELASLKLDPKMYLGEDKLQKVLVNFSNLENTQDLLANVGSGLLSVQSVINKLRGVVPESAPLDPIRLSKTKEGKLSLSVNGNMGVLASRARCCNPIPGDEVVGYVTRGRGIMIHRKVCPNAQSYQTHEPERLLPYDWPADGDLYRVDLKIISLNRHGLLMDVSTIFGEARTNVSAAKVRTMPNQTAEIDVSIDVRDTAQLSQIMIKLSHFSDVISVLRQFGRTAHR